jgi:hypothetical protein
MVASHQISVDRSPLPEASGQASMLHLHRVVYRHEWADLEEWVGAVRALADLSDAAIDELATAGSPSSH